MLFHLLSGYAVPLESSVGLSTLTAQKLLNLLPVYTQVKRCYHHFIANLEIQKNKQLTSHTPQLKIGIGIAWRHRPR